MTDIQTKAKNQYNALASILGGGPGDFDAASEVLRDLTGADSVDDLNDEKAKRFCDHVLSKFGAWQPGQCAMNDARDDRPVRSTDGSRKAVIDPGKIYERWNRRKAGVVINEPSKSKIDDAAETNTHRDPAEDATLPRNPPKKKTKKTLDDIATEVYADK